MISVDPMEESRASCLNGRAHLSPLTPLFVCYEQTITETKHSLVIVLCSCKEVLSSKHLTWIHVSEEKDSHGLCSWLQSQGFTLICLKSQDRKGQWLKSRSELCSPPFHSPHLKSRMHYLCSRRDERIEGGKKGSGEGTELVLIHLFMKAQTKKLRSRIWMQIARALSWLFLPTRKKAVLQSSTGKGVLTRTVFLTECSTLATQITPSPAQHKRAF